MRNGDKSIVIVGDTFPVTANQNYFMSGDVQTLFGEKICDIFSKASLRVCNLEGALSDNPDRCNKVGAVLVAPQKVVHAYKELGIDYCTLANNHITDGGHKGLYDTITTLNQVGIQHIGAGLDVNDIKHYSICNLDNLKVGIYNVCEQAFNRPSAESGGAWLYDEYIVCREIAKLKSQCDYLVVIYHGGIEYFRYPSPELRKRFHRMADNGANIILSQHTHCVGCEEWYNGSYLLYGQGNFIFRDYSPGMTDEGLIIELVFSEGRVEVKKHLVKCIDKSYIRYDEIQDLSGFRNRSELLKDEDFVNKAFQEFCVGKTLRFLGACRNQSVLYRAIRKMFPSIANWYLLKTFRLRNLLIILFNLRNEQFHEQSVVGMENLLDEVL